MYYLLLSIIPLMYFIIKFINSDMNALECILLTFTVIGEYTSIVLVVIGFTDERVLYVAATAVAIQFVVILQYWFRNLMIYLLTRNDYTEQSYSASWKTKLEEKTND